MFQLVNNAIFLTKCIQQVRYTWNYDLYSTMTCDHVTYKKRQDSAVRPKKVKEKWFVYDLQKCHI